MGAGDPLDQPRCTATAKSTHQQCRNTPVLGTNVCRIHGGAAPQVRQAGARRILESLVGPALTELARIIRNPDVADTVKITAIRDLLDRTGYKPTQTVEVITMDAVEREIARLEAELAGND